MGCATYIIIILLLFTLQTKTLMGEVMKEATFSLAEANFAAGDFRYSVVRIIVIVTTMLET